jgi:HEAT repeat protein
MTEDHPPRPGARLGWIVFVLLVLAGLAGAVAYVFRQPLGDEWALQKFRRAAAADDPDLVRHREMLTRRLGQEERLDRAADLAVDPDPKVRAAAIDVLMAGQPRAQKREAVAGVQFTSRATAWRTAVVEAVRKLLKDNDDTVRLKAIRAVAESACADEFGGQLNDAIHLGSPAEREAVAATLAHWNGSLLREVIGDLGQPDEVRVAAMKSLDTYGDNEVGAFRGGLQQMLVIALKAENPEVRRAAITALRHARMAANVWLDVLLDAREKELHPLALQTWIETLGNDTLPRAFSWHWDDTHEIWFHSTGNALRCGTAAYVLCAAAKLQTRHLESEPVVGEMAALRDRTGPTGRSFDMQLTRLGNVLSVLSAVRWYGETIEKPPELSVWLPHEAAAGAPPKRDMKAYLFREAQPVWEWCLAHKDGYPTRFLTENAIVRTYGSKVAAEPVAVRPLGASMESLLVGPDEFDRLRKRYDEK